MIRPQPTPQPLIATGLPIDHIGIVVHDLAAEVAAWRAAGFLVSDPVPLMGAGAAGEPVPLGQSSAHVVFHNGYVELSSPVPGSGNHLEPYLARGEGVRILVIAAGDAEAARQKLASAWPRMPEVRRASRSIIVGDEQQRPVFAGFRFRRISFPECSRPWSSTRRGNSCFTLVSWSIRTAGPGSPASSRREILKTCCPYPFPRGGS